MQIRSSDNSVNVIQEESCSWDLKVLSEQTENKLLYGGVVTWIQDYEFHVTAAGYYINDIFYESPAADVTLSPAHPSLDRIDVIYVDADGIVKVKEGDPSLTPSQPGLDLGLELGLGIIFVEAGSTQPVEIVQECIDDEVLGWVATTNDSSIDPTSGNTPCNGSVVTEATASSNGDTLTFTRNTPFSPAATYNVITFELKPKGDWSTSPVNNHSLKLQFRLGGVNVGSEVTVSNGIHFDSTDLTCQTIGISIIQFGLAVGDSVDSLRITVASNSGTFGWFLDALCLQGGIFAADEGDFIWNQYFGPQTPGRYWIHGNGRADGWFTSPQRIGTSDAFYDGSEKFGWGSSCIGSTATAIGYLARAEGQEGATAIGNQSVAEVGVAVGFSSHAIRSVAVGGSSTGSGGTAIGLGALNTGLSGTALGGNTTVSGISGIALGYFASAANYGAMAIGASAQSFHDFSTTIGTFAKSTAPRQVVWGGNDPFSDFGYTSMYFGTGVTSPFNADRFWTITGSEGTDVAGNKWTFAGAPGTGNAPSGPLEWQTSDPTVSGSTLQSLSTKMTLNSNTKGFYLDNIRFQMDEGSDVPSANNLTLSIGNSFTVTGNTTINAITDTNWQDGAVVYLLFTDAPTLKHNTAGGAGTSRIKLAGAVDFAATPDTVLALKYKDGFWREIGRTQTSAIGNYTFLNGLHEELGGLVKWGGPLIEDTTITGNTFSTSFLGGNGFFVGTINEIQGSTEGDIIFTSNSAGSIPTVFTMNQAGNMIGSSPNLVSFSSDDGIGNYSIFTLDNTAFAFKYKLESQSAGLFTQILHNDGAEKRLQLYSDQFLELESDKGTVNTGRFNLDEGATIASATNLALGYGGNAFTITGNVQVETISTTDWEEGATITLYLTGTPTLKHNTPGGAGTLPLRLAGAVDFVVTGHTVLELQMKDGFWNEVGRTQEGGAGITGITADNGITENVANNVQLGSSLSSDTDSPLLHNTYVNTAGFGLTVRTGTAGITPFTAVATTGVAGQFNSTSGIAMQSFSGVEGASITTERASTSTVERIATLNRLTTGTPVNGIGGYLDFGVQTTVQNQTANQLASKWVDATDATRTSQLDIIGVNSTANNTIMSAHGSGVVGIGVSSSYTATRLHVVDNTLGAASMARFITTSTAATGSDHKAIEVNMSGANAASGAQTYGIYSTNTHSGTSSINTGVFGSASNAITNYGVRGLTSATTGAGVWGLATGGAAGVFASSSSSGHALSSSNTGTGGYSGEFVHTGASGTVTSVHSVAQGASTTNIGGTFEALNATNNHAIIVPSGSGNVGIGTSSPSSQALLELVSTNRALLIMRMTSTQASAITAADGMMLYVTDTNGTFISVGFWGRENGAWVKL